MAMVTVYARHSKKCPKSKENGAGQYRRCNCPKWLGWAKAEKQLAKTRSWEIASKKARKLEEELKLKALGIEPRRESKTSPSRPLPICIGPIWCIVKGTFRSSAKRMRRPKLLANVYASEHRSLKA
jgi:hypothetical protein